MFPCGDAEIPVKIQVNLLARLDRCCRELLRLTAAKGSKGTTRQQPACTSFAWLVNCSPPMLTLPQWTIPPVTAGKSQEHIITVIPVRGSQNWVEKAWIITRWSLACAVLETPELQPVCPTKFTCYLFILVKWWTHAWRQEFRQINFSLPFNIITT